MDKSGFVLHLERVLKLAYPATDIEVVESKQDDGRCACDFVFEPDLDVDTDDEEGLSMRDRVKLIYRCCAIWVKAQASKPNGRARG